ncbi:amino acid adenylation domain-containing protein [Nostocales cyanobacterium LEGE 11386]|nr:amino acid adenylation domain-containing protein [Nostocales cyanobacterium LEGE 11386]
MNLHELLVKLSECGVKLCVDKNNSQQLHIRAAKGTLTPELQKSLTEHKAQILLLLRELDTGINLAELPTITPCPQERHQPFPLTDMQHAFWVGRSGVLELGNLSNHGYYEIEGYDLNLERLNWGLQQLIERHEMLRAIVLPEGQQQILDRVPLYQMPIVDLKGKDEETINQELATIRDRLSHQVLPAHQWPLFEFSATLLDQKRVRLHVSYDLLVFDAWSLFRLFEEWFQLYQNPGVALPPLELSFRDYVLAEQRLQQSSIYQRSQDYWYSRLDHLPPPPDLPLAKNPQELKQPRCQRYQSHLHPDDWQKLQQKAARIGLTSSGVLLAAFAEILTLWSKHSQFTLNIALFNRLPLHPQIQDILGDFTSATLLAIDNSPPDTFTNRALRLQQQLWQDLEHRYFSGVKVTRELARQQGIYPIAMPIVFTSTLGLSKLSQKTLTFSHFGELVYGISQASQVWIDVQVWEEKGVLTFNWDVVEELFPAGLIADMFEAYCRFLQQLFTTETAWVETTRQLISPIQLAQRDAVNATNTNVADELLHTLFTTQIPMRAEIPAVIAPQRTLSYRELSQKANQLGHRLRRLGVQPNQLVAVVMEKGWEQIIAVLGILISGSAYVPIDPQLPRERREYLLENSGTQIIITQSWLREVLDLPTNIIQLCIEDLANEPQQPLEPIQTLDDLAYLIYTSGSTGFPKGVMINHRGVVNTILDINQRFGVNATDRVLALSSLSFDLSVYDIFGTLAAGGTIVIPQAARDREPTHWAQLCQQHQITLWNSVPALMQMMVDYAINHPEVLAHLRLVLLSGDWLPLSLPTQIQTFSPDIQVISLGGATEASIWSILYPINAVDPTWKSIPYGYPMINQSFHVLNAILEPCPVWVPGQLYIGGVGLARGYWQQDEKTATNFLTHPSTGERLYRTGDLGRYLPDGTIEFLGREDSQVKIGGYRIELGEIEAVLVQNPAVRAAVVTVVGEAPSDRRLIAYVVLHNIIPANELSHLMREQLPEYMVPSVFIILDTLPLSANGKVDRRSLPQPENLLLNAEEDYVAPQTDIEQRIATVWQAVLNLENVGVNHNFFEIGGNSLLIIKIFNKLTIILPDYVEYISLVDLFKYPTIQSLAKYCDQAKQSNVSQQQTVKLKKQLQDAKSRIQQRFHKSRVANL